ncbi:MAG: T9SS type A sorting domain-containing protein [Bacteroidota bacterium]
MKRILQLLPCLYFCLVSAWSQAQEPIIISFPETEVQPNAEFCVDVQATNFTDITAIQFAVEWDSDLLEYQSLNLNTAEDVTYLPNLRESDFSVHDNVLRFVWIDFVELNQRVTLPEESTLFQICFKAAGEESSASIAFSDAIQGEGVRASDLKSIPVIGEDAAIDINDANSTDLVFTIGSKDVNEGETFCVPITAQKLKNLASIEFDIIWNEELLLFKELKTPEEDILEITAARNYQHQAGYFRFTWVELDDPLFLEVPDDFVLFELCFEAMGSSGNQAKIEFSDSSFEVNSFINDDYVVLPVELENGRIDIGGEIISGDPTLLVADAIVEPQEEFCLPILAQNMPPIAGLQFEVAWDKEKLESTSIQLGENVLGIAERQYTLREDAFGLVWNEFNAQNIELDETEVLFELCFLALGEQGEQTIVSFGSRIELEVLKIIDNNIETVEVQTNEGVITFSDAINTVLPGDTNLDSEANHYDLINIGLGYGQAGPTRENATLDFTPQPAEDWATSTPITNINYKHSDTNGDGEIDAEDTEAIDLNWTSTPTLVNTVFTDEGVPFYVDSGVLNLSETNQLPIILGTEDQMAEKIYSIAFSIYYEAETMLEDGLAVTLENSWLGLEEELISVQRFFPEEKRIDVAISRIDQQGMTGFGELGALNIVMEDVILFQDEQEVKFFIDHVQSIGEAQAEGIGMGTQPSIAQIQQSSVSTTDFLNRVIKIYPNPASVEVKIAADGMNVERAELHDIYGKPVSTIYQSNQVMVEMLPTGIYFLTIHTNKGSTTKKINIR